MDCNYKFVNLVDPNKCSAKIKDKFSKLTLSSNKKKQEESEMPQDIHDKVELKRISRNLLSELLTDDESDKDDHAKPQDNLLMRTDSSSIGDCGSGNFKLLNATDATHCSQVEQERDKSLEMESLKVSYMENTEQFDQEIEKLSTRVSSLAVISDHQEISRIVSTDHQRMGSGNVCSPAKLKPILKKEPDISICVSSDDDNDSDSPITISDSSSEEEQKPEPEPEHEPNVSSIIAPCSSQNMTNAKANQMAAFLRDVRKNYGLPVDTAEPDSEFERRQREIANADTEPMTENDSRSAGTGTARRIATADTESMTEATERETSSDKDRRLALDDTEDMTMGEQSMHSSRHYNPVMRVDSALLDESIVKTSDPVPEDSLTIAETSDEEEESSERQEPKPTPQTSDNSSALRRTESSSQLRSRNSSESSGNSQVQISISAKINIKIQVSQQMEDSSSTDVTDSFQSNDKSATKSTEDELPPHNSAQKANNNQSRAIEDIPHSPPERDIPEVEPQTPAPDFIDKAQQLLNELYGDQWMTPAVIRSLKKVSATSSKRTGRRAPVSKENSVETTEFREPTKLKAPDTPPERLSMMKPNENPTDESVLADFSIFRRDIPQDLDSTRLPTIFKAPTEVVTTPMTKTVRARQRKAPTEEPPKTETIQTTKTRSGREVRQNWKNLIETDSESEGDNASGDSEHSWQSSEEDDEIENKKPSPPRSRRAKKAQNSSADLKNDDKLVFLDLSKAEVEIDHNVSADSSPPAHKDKAFTPLREILETCKYEDKPKIATPVSKPKRKLFTAQINEDFDNIVAPLDLPREGQKQTANADEENVSISGGRMPAKFEPFNKYLEAVKRGGKPIFKIQTPKANRKAADASPGKSTKSSTKKPPREILEISGTPRDKYGFLKSLDVCVGKSHCHPDALYYKENFRLKKEELATRLYEIYNNQCFSNKLDVPLVWNKKLLNTAGRCMNKKRLGERTCVIELSEKVLTSPDRLRCTLIHELCHAATWICQGESGHGATWKAWARKANLIFPELPKIGVCHQYDIEYKYTYKCTLCGAKSHAHSKSKKVENIRCSYCHGSIEVYLNKKDKEGNVVMTPVKEATGFAKFVKDRYKEFKRPDLKHADVMKLLSSEFAAMKVDNKS